MPKFQWKNRREFYKRCAARVTNDFLSIQKHLKEIGISPEKFGIDLDGIIDLYLNEYSYNPGWMGKVTDKKVKIDIINEVYEYARMKKIELLKNWAIKKLEELK